MFITTFSTKDIYVNDYSLNTNNFEKLCDKAKQILTAQKQIIEINGIALFDGDIAPNVPVYFFAIVSPPYL